MAATIKVGDLLPSGTVCEGTPKGRLDITSLFKGKRGILFAVPGAFTPGCAKVHLPSYVENVHEFRRRGVGVIACVSVNDAFVMTAWGEASGCTDKIRMLADQDGSFTRSIGLELDARKGLGTMRSKRYAMIIDDGRVVSLQVEPDGGGLTVSLAESLLAELDKLPRSKL